MNLSAATAFAKWLAVDQPELFLALHKKATAGGGFSGFADLFSSLGSGLANAASSVGSYLTSSAGMQAITSLGGAYLNSQAARKAVQLNLQRAQAGAAPEPIQTAFNPATGQFEATASTGGRASAYIPAVMSRINWVPVALAGGALLVLFLFLRKR